MGHHERREDEQVARQLRAGLGDGAALAPDRAALLPGHPALPVDDRVQRGGPARGRVRVRADRGLRAAGGGEGRARGARGRGAAGLRRGDGRRLGRTAGAGRGAHHGQAGQQRAHRRRQGDGGRASRRGPCDARSAGPRPARPALDRRGPRRRPARRRGLARPAGAPAAAVGAVPQGLRDRRRDPRPARPGGPGDRGHPDRFAVDTAGLNPGRPPRR
ncbi:hypothetical protein SBRY_110128 [Actinacidiphila bryophytorum]|uniref:Uncharacterized protein n=1 Tax=Actinacidiphila bryophytorum TaxID=1436133 RepID=A0A9W4ED59_9ACTN|nr:hypothetical protein SBRY_110128 [Actinacidiphila bryophytorum]